MSREVDSRAKLIPQDACKGSRKQASTQPVTLVVAVQLRNWVTLDARKIINPHFVSTALLQLGIALHDYSTFDHFHCLLFPHFHNPLLPSSLCDYVSLCLPSASVAPWQRSLGLFAVAILVPLLLKQTSGNSREIERKYRTIQ